MPTQFSLPVVHPAFELLKRSARVLHFIAAAIIIYNALHILLQHHGNKIIFYSQLIIAVDIFLLVLFCKQLLVEAPRLNFIFRFIESVTILGIAISLFSDGHFGYGLLHLFTAGGYLFLFYREWRVMRSEAVDISQTGISVPNFLKDVEISWNEVKSIMPKYHSIIIETFHNKKIQFNLRENLKIEELAQINDFCSRHLVNG